MTSRERAVENVWLALCRLAAAAGVSVMALTVIALAPGAKVIDLAFLTRMWRHRDLEAGGIAQAIAGSAFLGAGVAALAFPLGLATAVYLVEFSRRGAWSRAVKMTVRNLAGVPSVVFGLFGLAVFGQALRLGPSLAAAAATLALMAVPWMITSAVEALEAVPDRQRDASLALGATRWQTVSRVTVPTAMPGCITGAVLGVARALGETAPIILVGATFFLTGMPDSPLDRFMALPYHAFILATQHNDPRAMTYASATALVLIALTACLSLGAIIARSKLRKRRL